MYAYSVKHISVRIGRVLIQDTHEQWQTYLLITAVMMLVTSVAYLLKSSGDVQPWAKLNGVSKCVDDVTDVSTDSSDSYTTSASHNSMNSLTVAKQRTSLALDDVFVVSRGIGAANDVVMGTKYGTLPRSFREQPDPTRTTAVAAAAVYDPKLLYRSTNFKRYGTLPLHWDDTSGWRRGRTTRNHASDNDVAMMTHAGSASSNRRLLQTPVYASGAQVQGGADRQVVVRGGASGGGVGHVGDDDDDRESPPSTADRPSTSSHSSARAPSIQLHSKQRF